MIRYQLRCERDHAFESWFRDSAAYDALRAAGQVTCAVCGCAEVEKALMAPAVRKAEAQVAEAPVPALSAPPQDGLHRALVRLRAELEAKADYVGTQFAEEARRLHADADAQPARPIWGEATLAEARALLEDGIPVAPLPPLPRRDD